ncbi:hypothetical protein LAV76_01865 [Bacillus paramobilis]|uniref:hypothetical protein n=1 Tax=Bacillus paramobilis TaxID=2817477 RepID=UPI0030C90B35
MELTNIEKAIAIGTILSALTEEELGEYVGLEQLQVFIEQGEVLGENITPNGKKEADKNLINKLMDSFLEESKSVLEESKSVESNETVQDQTTEA